MAENTTQKYIIEFATTGASLAAKQLNDFTNAAERAQKVVLAPSGISAQQELAYKTPGFARTAEQRALLERIPSATIIRPSGYFQPLGKLRSPTGRFISPEQQKAGYFLKEERVSQAINVARQEVKQRGMSLAAGFYPASLEVAKERGEMASQASEIASQESKKLFETKLSSIQTQFKEGTLSGIKYKRELGNLGKEFGKTTGEINKLDLSHKSLISSQVKLAMRAVTVIPIWMALRAVYMGLAKAISSTLSFWKEYEEALVQIMVVGEASIEEVKNLGESVLNLSVIYGVSAIKALEAAKIFAQQGLTIEQTLSMTRSTIIATAVLGEDAAVVAEELTSAIRAYNMNMQDGLSIVDKWMAVQKSFAVTSKDLAEATKTAGATASAMGISYDKFLGHVTGIIEITRKSGSEVANALQMIYSRLLTVGSEAIQTIAKVPIYQTAVGQAVMETTNIYRSASDVLDEVAMKWDILNESQKINLASQIGSRRQLTPFIALMQNYNRSLEAEIVSLKSAGDALKSFSIIEDTVITRTKQMQSAFAQLVESISQTSIWKDVILSLTNWAQAFDILINKSKTLVNIERTVAEQALGSAEARYNEIDSILKLTEARDKYNKMLESAPTELKPKISGIIGKINEALGGQTATQTSLDMALRNKLSAQTKFENPELLAKLTEAYTNLQSAKDALKGGWSLIPVVKQEAQIAIPEQEKQIEVINKQLDEITNKKLSQTKLEKEKNDLLKIGEGIEREAENTLNQEVALLEHRANMLQTQGKTEEDILRFKIQQYSTDEILKSSTDARVTRTKLIYELEEKIANKIKEQSDILKGDFTDAFKELMGGGSFFETFNKGIVENYRNVVSEGLSNIVMSTGLGDIFGTGFANFKNIFSGTSNTIEGKIEAASETGGKIFYNWITKAARDSQGGVGGALTANWSGGQGTGYLNPAGTDMGNLIMNYSGGGGNVGGGFGQLSAKYGGKASLLGRLGGAKGIGGSAMVGYSAYQSNRQGGMGKGMSAASGILTGVGALGTMGAMGAFGAGFTGYMATNAAMAASMGGAAAGLGGGSMMGGVMAGLGAIGPVGWIALAALAAGMAMSMFGKKAASQTSVETKTTESRIASKIEVTNRNLSIINRNLVALRSDITTYILPSSAYFAERRNVLEEQFAINSRRAFTG